MDYNSLDKASQDRLVNQVMQGYGRMRPSDRNAVVSYLQSNPDYANTVGARLGIQGAQKADDRYENVQDSTAMRTLMKSLDNTETDVAKPSPTAASGKKGPAKSAAPKSTRYGVDGGGEGLNPRQGMQSEAASDEIARRQDTSREANRAGGFKNIAPNESDAPETSDTSNKAQGQGTSLANEAGKAVVGLGTGAAVGYGINRIIDNLFSTETPSAKSARALGQKALPAPEAVPALPAPQSRALVPVDTGREVIPTDAPSPAPQGSRMMLPPPEQRMAIDYQPGVTLDSGMANDIRSILEAPPGGAATHVPSVRGTDPTVPYGNTDNIGAATMRSIRTQSKRMGKFK